MKITKLCVLGERVSGTCFVQTLVTENTNLKLSTEYGHKHFYQDTNKIQKEDTSDTLFVFISRDLVDWLNSFKNNTFHADKPIRNCKDMGSFLRMEWKCIFDQTSGTPETSSDYGKEMLFERNPEDGQRFRNVIQMRNSKLRHFLSVQQRVENYIHVRYEDARDKPLEFLENLKKQFSIPTKPVFKSIDTVRGKGRVPYQRKNYKELSETDMDFVVENVDVDLESQLGYLG